MNRFGWPLVVCASAYFGGLTAPWLFSLGQGSAQARRDDSPPAAAREETRFEAVARKISPSVVAIESLKPAAGKARPIEDSGSGVLVKFPGRSGVFVLTNHHVIGAAPAKQITINLADGRIFKPSKVWSDPETDIAVLGLADEPGLITAPLGDSSRVRVGQWALAFGSPFGLNQTVTHGIISARGRGSVSLDSTIRIKDFLQTDAAINPGSSGGPLANLDGEVIAINTAIASPSKGSAGVAFSIPINMVKKIAGQLLDTGKVERGYLGVQLASGIDLNEALRLGLERAQGALIDGVQPESPAEKAGLRRGDVILELDSAVILNDNQFINEVAAMAPGKKVKIKVWRGGKPVLVDAVIGDWNAVASSFRR
jgi:S1-C subfamily serine protease